MVDNDKTVEDPYTKESDADSAAYTQEREEAGQEKLQLQQEQARQQFQFLGEPEPDLEIPNPEDRPLDMESLSDKEKEALETQNEIASEGYTPKTGEDFVGETFDSPDINPEAKEFQLKDDFSAPDEFTGPEAAAEAAETGVNPRSAATASDREGLEQPVPSDLMAPVSENAESVSKPRARAPKADKVLDDE